MRSGDQAWLRRISDWEHSEVRLRGRGEGIAVGTERKLWHFNPTKRHLTIVLDDAGALVLSAIENNEILWQETYSDFSDMPVTCVEQLRTARMMAWVLEQQWLPLLFAICISDDTARRLGIINRDAMEALMMNDYAGLREMDEW